MDLTVLTHHPQPAVDTDRGLAALVTGADPGLVALVAVALVLAAWALAAGLRTRHRRRPGPLPHPRRP